MALQSSRRTRTLAAASNSNQQRMRNLTDTRKPRVSRIGNLMRRGAGSRLLALGLSLGAATMANAQTPLRGELVPCRSVSAKTCAIAKQLGRGVNLGDMLDAPREGDWGQKAETRYLQVAASWFDTVRVPVKWTNHAAATADATLDPVFAARVDQVIDDLLARNVNVVLDVHHYGQLFGDYIFANEFTVAPEVLETRLVNIWRQLALRYRDRSSRLVLELLNEPHGKVTADGWNALMPRLLAAIREADPERTVIIGGSDYNSINDIGKLRLPADPNVIVTFHTYEPMAITHQGISWFGGAAPLGTPCCDAAQQAQVNKILDVMRTWSVRSGYPVMLGEFGITASAPQAAKEAYLGLMRSGAEARGFPWAVWELVGTFGLIDPVTLQWNEGVRSTLLPPR